MSGLNQSIPNYLNGLIALTRKDYKNFCSITASKDVESMTLTELMSIFQYFSSVPQNLEWYGEGFITLSGENAKFEYLSVFDIKNGWIEFSPASGNTDEDMELSGHFIIDYRNEFGVLIEDELYDHCIYERQAADVFELLEFLLITQNNGIFLGNRMMKALGLLHAVSNEIYKRLWQKIQNGNPKAIQIAHAKQYATIAKVVELFKYEEYTPSIDFGYGNFRRPNVTYAMMAAKTVTAANGKKL